MKLVKAYIRILMVDDVIHALEKINISNISVIDIPFLLLHLKMLFTFEPGRKVKSSSNCIKSQKRR